MAQGAVVGSDYEVSATSFIGIAENYSFSGRFRCLTHLELLLAGAVGFDSTRRRLVGESRARRTGHGTSFEGFDADLRVRNQNQIAAEATKAPPESSRESQAEAVREATKAW